MTDRSHSPDPGLPPSHYFITIARGTACRTVTVRTLTARLCLAGLAIVGGWTVASSLYLGVHDDLVAALMQREARAQYVYEDRIASLRADVDREASRQLVGRSALEDEVRDLSKRADALQVRATLVDQAVGHVGGRPAARDAANADPEGRTGPAPTVAPSAWGEKPHPEAQAEPEPAPRRADADDGAPVHARLFALTQELDQVDASQYRAVAEAGSAARRRAAALRTALSDAGLMPERFASAASSAAVGGPFVPLAEEAAPSLFGQALVTLQADTTVADRLASAVPHVPFARPLAGTADVTSPFGARLDPFLGRPALHTGVDLRETAGAEVRATASGRIVSAGPLGGYGLMIEVDHGNGLATRYAHLSAVLVGSGDRVAEGQVIGQVGQTGRATGPHLHYETRIDGEPVDPMRFLQAGERLAAADVRLPSESK